VLDALRALLYAALKGLAVSFEKLLSIIALEYIQNLRTKIYNVNITSFTTRHFSSGEIFN